MGIFDARLDLANRLANYRPQVTTLSDVLYGTPQKPKPVSGLSAAALQGDPLADLRKQATTMFRDSQRRSQALQIADTGKQQDEGGWRGLVGDVLDNPIAKTILKPLEVLDYGRRAVLATVQEAGDFLEGKGWSNDDWKDQFDDPNFGFGTIIGDMTGIKWVDRALGFIGDVAFDPLTYVSFGAGALMKKAGIEATGAAARLALAEKVLSVTGDAAKAQSVAKGSISAARKVLTASELADVGIGRAGVFFFGKNLPAVRVPLSGRLAEAGESAMTRMRLAATSTRVGGVVQKGITPKWMKEERLKLLRGEAPEGEFAEKLVALNSRNAYRASAAEAHRSAATSFRNALKVSGVADSPDLRARMHVLLEGIEQPMNAAERNALTAWKTAFGQMWDAMDKRLAVLDPNHTVGRVDRYFPHLVTDEGRAWLRGGSTEAKKIIEMFGLDDLGPTTFFNPRRLKKGSEFFGTVLDVSDLNVKRLNEIAKNGGFVGEFFDTDILRVAEKYSADYAEQMGRIGSIAHMVDNGTITHIEQKLEYDPDLAKAAQREYQSALGRQLKAAASASEASSRAARALDGHFAEAKKAEQRLLTASAAEARVIAAPVEKAQKVLDDAIVAFESSKKALEQEKDALRSLLDPALDDELVNQVERQYAEIISAVDDAAATYRQYQELQQNASQVVAMGGQRLEDARKLAKDKADDLAALTSRRKDLIAFQQWLGANYEAIVSGAEEIAPHGIGGVPSLTFMRTLFGSSHDADALKQYIGRYAATEGEFSDYLDTVLTGGGNEDLVALLGSDKARSAFSKMTVAKADEVLRSSSMNAGGLPTIVAGSVRIAQVLYAWGGRDKVPEYMLKMLDDAQGALKELSDLRKFERLVAEAPRQGNQYERLLQRYGSLAEEIEEDLVMFNGVSKRLAAAEDEWTKWATESETQQKRLAGKKLKPSERAAAQDSLLVAGFEAERAAEDVAKWESQLRLLENKRYTLAGEQSEKTKRLLEIAQDEAVSSPDEAVRLKAQETIDRYTPREYGIADAADRLQRNVERVQGRQLRQEVAQSATASLEVAESRRVPLSAEQRNLRAQVKRAADARVELAGGQATDARRALLEKRIADGEAAAKRLNEIPSENAPWRVTGETAQDMRHNALFKMEEFVIAADVAQRFAVVSERLAAVGMEASEKMLDDLMRSVRTARMEKWLTRSSAYERAAVLLRDGIGSLRAEMAPEELRAAVFKVRTELFDALGDEAASVLGPRAQWAQDPKQILDQISVLDRSVNNAAKGSAARAAAIEARKEYYATVAKVFYRDVNVGLAGKTNMDDVKRALKQMAKEVDSGSLNKAAKSLREMEKQVLKEAAFSRRLKNLYRQVDDVDYNAMQALQEGIGTRQPTPKWRAASHEAAAAAIERRIEALRAAAEADNLGRANAARERLMAGRTVEAATERIGAEKEKLADLQARLQQFEASPQAQVARAEQNKMRFLQQFSNVDGWKLKDEDWAALGLQPLPQFDPEKTAALQGFIDSRLRDGQQTFIKKKEMVRQQVGGRRVSAMEQDTLVEKTVGGAAQMVERDVFVPVSRADEVPHGATLYTSGQGWVEINAEEAGRLSGWKPAGVGEIPKRKTQKIVEDLESQISVARREVEGREAALRNGMEMLARAEADPSFKIRRPLNVPKRVQQIDDEIGALQARRSELLRTPYATRAEFDQAMGPIGQQIDDLVGERERLLAFQNRSAGAEEVFGRAYTDTGIEGTVEYNLDVPLRSEMMEEIPLDKVRAAVDEMRWDLTRRKSELTALGDQLQKARTYDALAEKHMPPTKARQTLEEAVLSNQNLKVETVEDASLSRIGATVSDRPVLDENGVPTGMFEADPLRVGSKQQVRKYYKRGNAGSYTPLPWSENRVIPEPITFSREEWESLFVYGLDDLVARRRVVSDAGNAARRAKKIEGQIAEAKRAVTRTRKTIAKLEQKFAAMPRAQAGRAGRSRANARAFALEEIESTKAVLSAHEADIVRLNGELEQATQVAKTASQAVRDSAMRKFSSMMKAFRSRNPNGFDDVAFKMSQSVLSDGRFNTVSDAIVSRRGRMLDQGWQLTPHYAVTKQLEMLSSLGVTAVGVANARGNMSSHLRRLQQLKNAADLRFGDAIKDVQEAAADLADRARVEMSPNILSDASAAANWQRTMASVVGKTEGASRAGLVGEVDPEFIKRTADDLVPAAQAAKADADQVVAAAAEDTNVLGRVQKAVADRVEEQRKAVLAADADAVKKIDALVRQSGDWQSALAKKREAAQRGAGKAQGKYDKVSSAAVEAAWVKVQAQMDAAYAISQSNLPQRAQDAVRAREGLEAAIFDKDMLERVRKGKTASKARRSELMAQSRMGAQARQRILLNAEISDKELVRLERAAQTGEKADKILAALDASDDQAIQMMKVYKDVLALDTLPPNDPLRAVLSDAVSREADLLLAQNEAGAAEYWLLNQQAFSYRMVDDIKKGWTSLSDWGLPSLQSSETLKEMFDNLSRVENPSLLGELNGFLSRYTRFFKTYATLSVGFHVRNAMSNTLMVFGAGADVSNMARGMRLYEGWLTAEREGGDAMRLFLEGLEKTGQREVFEASLRATDAAGVGRSIEMFADEVGTLLGSKWTNNWATQASRRFGERVEGSGRFMLAYDSVVKGADFNQATARVKRYLFDYMDTSSLDAAVKNIIPFWIWMSRNFPLQVVNQWQNPKMYAMYSSLMRNVAAPEDGEIVPEWMRETGAVKVGDGMFLAPDTGFNRLGQQAKEFADPARLASYVNPLLRVPVEVLGKRRLYNDTPFSEKPKEVTGGLASPLVEAMLGLLGQTDTTGPKGVFNAAGDQVLPANATVTSDRWNYALMNLLPMLAQSERLVPATEDYKARQASSVLNYLGIPLRELTQQMQDAEVNRRQREIEQLATTAKNLGYTP